MAYYVKNTKDDIVKVSASGASGYDSKVVNIGEVQNNGFEFMVDAYPVKTKDFLWNTTLNFSYNNSEVKELGGADRMSVDGAQSRVGNAYVYQIVGRSYGQIVGFDYKRDANGNILLKDGLPQTGEQKSFGTGVAPWAGGWRNSFSYKDFTLGFLVDFRFGGKIFTGTNYQLYYYGMHQNTLTGRTAANPVGAIVAAGIDEATGQANTKEVTSQAYYRAICNQNITAEFIHSSDFVKLRELSLGWNVPTSMLPTNYIKGLNVSLVARNLWTIIKHTPNVDPESSINNTNGQGLELNGYPVTRNIGLNVNVKF